jgi:hypothetical protein
MPLNRYSHESNLAAVRPDDKLQPMGRLFTGTPRVNRAYVLNRTTGQVIEACGHRHRSSVAAFKCAKLMTAKQEHARLA